jgi:hypothetical protein
MTAARRPEALHDFLVPIPQPDLIARADSEFFERET